MRKKRWFSGLIAALMFLPCLADRTSQRLPYWLEVLPGDIITAPVDFEELDYRVCGVYYFFVGRLNRQTDRCEVYLGETEPRASLGRPYYLLKNSTSIKKTAHGQNYSALPVPAHPPIRVSVCIGRNYNSGEAYAGMLLNGECLLADIGRVPIVYVLGAFEDELDKNGYNFLYNSMWGLTLILAATSVASLVLFIYIGAGMLMALPPSFE
ncbi:MAG: hypothetical protein ACR2PT_04610 [Endozoicomonas sp.]